MATFKVGQRVKKIANRSRLDPSWDECLDVPMNAEGVVKEVQNMYGEVTVVFDFDGKRSSMPAYTLAPLTDPKADEFIESIRKLKPLHEEPKVQRTKQDA
jgi:hypothetical protein